MEIINRSWTLDSASITREAENEDAVRFEGHASVFDQPTLIGSTRFGFIEEVARDAFSEVLDDDVRLLVNHDGLPLARTTNGTLRLRQDSVGLYNDADLAPTSLTRDLVVLLERGDVNQQSFAFTLDDDSVEWGKREHEGVMMEVRTIRKVKRLYDTSIVTYPAYEGATGGLRTARVSDDEIKNVLRTLRSEEEVIDELEEVRNIVDADSLLREHMTRGKALGVRSKGA